MTTEKQKQSNRENAKHSTGPKTDQGKQRSSQNALKHGIYAVESVIPGEDPADFDELCTEFGERYDPEGPYERSLVRQMPTPNGACAASCASKLTFSNTRSN